MHMHIRMHIPMNVFMDMKYDHASHSMRIRMGASLRAVQRDSVSTKYGLQNFKKFFITKRKTKEVTNEKTYKSLFRHTFK